MINQKDSWVSIHLFLCKFSICAQKNWVEILQNSIWISEYLVKICDTFEWKPNYCALIATDDKDFLTPAGLSGELTNTNITMITNAVEPI